MEISGFGVSGFRESRLRAQGFGVKWFRICDYGIGFLGLGLGFGVWGLGYCVESLGFGVWGLGFGV